VVTNVRQTSDEQTRGIGARGIAIVQRGSPARSTQGTCQGAQSGAIGTNLGLCSRWLGLLVPEATLDLAKLRSNEESTRKSVSSPINLGCLRGRRWSRGPLHDDGMLVDGGSGRRRWQWRSLEQRIASSIGYGRHDVGGTIGKRILTVVRRVRRRRCGCEWLARSLDWPVQRRRQRDHRTLGPIDGERDDRRNRRRSDLRCCD
jgi:hypothetical protein